MKVLKIDPQEYASQGSAILGIRDSGKSYTATKIAETLFDSGIPFVAFDPIGVWKFLRMPGKGRGYPVVVAGGEDGDLPLTPQNAAAIMRAAMEGGVSIIVDLFDPRLSKADWKRIVEASVSTLLFENKKHGLRHIFVEEAAEFVPQIIPKDGVTASVYSIFERLSRMGGNNRLGYTLINQRAEQINKAVLELCDNLLLHRQKGKNSINSLGKWLDIAGVGDAKEIERSLPTLPQGQCWTWLAGDTHATLVSVPAKKSFSPDRRAMRGDKEAPIPTAVDTGKFVATLKDKLGSIEKEAKENDPKALRSEIVKLKGDLKTALSNQSAATPAPDKRLIEQERHVAYLAGIASGRSHIRGVLSDMEKSVVTLLEKTTKEIERLCDKAHDDHVAADRKKGPTNPASPAVSRQPASAPASTPKPLSAASGDGDYTGPQRKVLASLMFWRSVGTDQPSRDQVAAVAGYSPGSGNFNNLLGGLKATGAIDYPAQGQVCITFAYTEVPSAQEAKETLLNKVLGGPHRKILVAMNTLPSPATRDQIAEASEYSAGSGNFNNLLGKLRTLSVIDYPGQGLAEITGWAKQLLEA